jgi:O-antigen ligase
MMLTLGLILATLGAAAVLFSVVVPPRVALRAAAALNTVQLHTISLLGVYPSLALLGWLSLWRPMFGSRLWQWPWMKALLALVAIQAASIAWSPTPMLGLRYLIYLLPLPLAAHAFYRVTRDDPQAAFGYLRLLLVGTSLVALLVIAFRLLPSLELALLRHPLAGLFMSPNTLEGLFDTARNNVLDPAKAGGVFVNANIASTYLGMSAIAAWYIGAANGSVALRAVAVLDWTAVLLTGSKAGLMFALAVPVGLTIVGMVRARQAVPARLLVAILGLTAGIVVLMLPVSQDLIAAYRYETLATLGARDELWGHAVQLISQRPLTGLGFGGWEKLFELQAFLTGSGIMPAHNSLLILWLQSGLFGLLAGICLIGTVYAAAVRALNSADIATRQFAMAFIGAFSWYFGQGLGENFGLVGEVHMTPLLGALLGHLCARCDSAAVRYQHDSETLCGDPAPPAIPAV